MRIAMNPAANENRQKQRANHDPKCGDEQGGKNGKHAHCQNDPTRNLKHRRTPQIAIVARFALCATVLSRIFATIISTILKGASDAL